MLKELHKYDLAFDAQTKKWWIDFVNSETEHSQEPGPWPLLSLKKQPMVIEQKRNEILTLEPLRRLICKEEQEVEVSLCVSVYVYVYVKVGVVWLLTLNV